MRYKLLYAGFNEFNGFKTCFAPQHVWCPGLQPKHVRLWFGAGGPNQNTCACGLVPRVPTKPRASVVWCHGPQPKHVRLWFGATGPNQNTSRIQMLRYLVCICSMISLPVSARESSMLSLPVSGRESSMLSLPVSARESSMFSLPVSARESSMFSLPVSGRESMVPRVSGPCLLHVHSHNFINSSNISNILLYL